MTQSWVCRPYRPGDEQDIIGLYRQIFRIEMTPQLWRWMYELCPHGPAVISVLESAGRLAGHYAVQPREFSFDNRRGPVGLAVGVMLLPEARNIGTLVELARSAYEMCQQRKMPWLYAFPNDASYRVHCGLLGWRGLPSIAEWDGPLPKVEQSVGDDVRTWRHFPTELKFNSFDTEHSGIMSHRCANWLRWRFFDRPRGEYVLHTVSERSRVTAFAVTKRYDRDAVRYGHLLDWRMQMEAAPRSAELLSSVWRQLAEWNVSRVSTWARGADLLADRLANAGLTQTGRTSNFCYLDLESHHGTALAQASGWHVEMADSDIY